VRVNTTLAPLVESARMRIEPPFGSCTTPVAGALGCGTKSSAVTVTLLATVVVVVVVDWPAAFVVEPLVSTTGGKLSIGGSGVGSGYDQQNTDRSTKTNVQQQYDSSVRLVHESDKRWAIARRCQTPTDNRRRAYR
jgi:hypothetical protein